MEKKLDDVIKRFEKEVENAASSFRPLWEEDAEKDELYNVDIHIWRKPGMGNSLQTISGNTISICTATISFLTTLLIKGIINEKVLDDMVEIAKTNYEEGLK